MLLVPEFAVPTGRPLVLQGSLAAVGIVVSWSVWVPAGKIVRQFALHFNFVGVVVRGLNRYRVAVLHSTVIS